MKLKVAVKRVVSNVRSLSSDAIIFIILALAAPVLELTVFIYNTCVLSLTGYILTISSVSIGNPGHLLLSGLRTSMWIYTIIYIILSIIYFIYHVVANCVSDF